jgi:hypothetical protein
MPANELSVGTVGGTTIGELGVVIVEVDDVPPPELAPQAAKRQTAITDK